MNKITGRQIGGLCLGIIVAYVSAISYDSYLERTEKMNKENHRRQLEMQLIQQQPKLMKIQQETIAKLTNIINKRE